jgi:hypothetical protein
MSQGEASHPRSRQTFLFGIAIAMLSGNELAHAQAWVEPKGNLNFSFDYSYATATELVENSDISVPNVDDEHHAFVLGAQYVPIDRLALQLAVPIYMLKYKGQVVHVPTPGQWDDGKYHTTLQDLRFGARYALIEELVALAPHVAISIPMADYAVIGNTTAGRGLKQLHVGASVGRTLEPLLPTLYLHGQYEFSLVEKYDATPETEEVGQNRSDLSFQMGYLFLDGDLDVNVAALIRIPHGGINFVDWAMLSEAEQLHHDPLLRERFFSVGGGAGYYITDDLKVSALARFFVSGENTLNTNQFSIGVSWDAM